jgi:hypothetical protein
MKKYKEDKMNNSIKIYIKRCWLNDINTQVIDTNFFEVQNKQKKMISIFYKKIFSLHT